MSNTRTFSDYLIELRTRLLRCLGAVAIMLVIVLPFSNALYHLLAKPLLKQLPNTSTLIATAVSAPFFIPLKFATLVAFVLAIPFLIYQGWLFIAPALYRHERRWLWLLMLLGTLLFYIGMLFAYLIVFPLLFNFFVQTTPAGVTLLPDITEYLNLALQLLIAFGLAFEVPIIIVILIASGVMSAQRIAQKRRYFIVFAFIIAMFITPPDVVSQTLLAVPLCLLFEAGLLLTRFVVKPMKRELTHES
jgi:sec-independent protein translocase protein TatC